MLDRTASADIENRNVRVVTDRTVNVRLVAVLTGVEKASRKMAKVDEHHCLR
jgi:hypothetical protein